MNDNMTEEQILEWWIMNTYYEYRFPNTPPHYQDRYRRILLMIDKELLLSRELSKNGRPEVVSEKEITEFWWKISFDYLFTSLILEVFISYNKIQKRKWRDCKKTMKERGVPKEEIERLPKPNQICLWGIFHSLYMCK